MEILISRPGSSEFPLIMHGMSNKWRHICLRIHELFSSLGDAYRGWLQTEDQISPIVPCNGTIYPSSAAAASQKPRT